MANDNDGAGQQDTQDNGSTEWTSSGEPPLEQEDRHTGEGESEQGHQGMVPSEEAAYEHSSLQEHEVPPQDEIGPQLQGAGELVDPTMEQQDEETPTSAPEELPEQELVPVPAEHMEAEDEQ